VALINGKASSGAIASLALGSHTVTASYSGEVSYTASTSALLTQAIKLSNDDFATRAPISGSSVSITSTNVGATKESGEPNHAGNAGGKSVWWTWTAPSSGTVTIDTLGSDYDTLLAAYTGTSVSGLSAKASNDNSADGGTNTSKISFIANAGSVYQVAIDGANGASGNISLHVGLVPLPPAPSAPSGVSASDGLYSDRVLITWTASAGATGYEVWRAAHNKTQQASKIGDLSGTSYDDSSANAGTVYYYWVKAKNAGGTSGFSASDSGYRARAGAAVQSFTTNTTATPVTFAKASDLLDSPTALL
jgi:hypothetical protein